MEKGGGKRGCKLITSRLQTDCCYLPAGREPLAVLYARTESPRLCGPSHTPSSDIPRRLCCFFLFFSIITKTQTFSLSLSLSRPSSPASKIAKISYEWLGAHGGWEQVTITARALRPPPPPRGSLMAADGAASLSARCNRAAGSGWVLPVCACSGISECLVCTCVCVYVGWVGGCGIDCVCLFPPCVCQVQMHFTSGWNYSKATSPIAWGKAGARGG